MEWGSALSCLLNKIVIIIFGNWMVIVLMLVNRGPHFTLTLDIKKVGDGTVYQYKTPRERFYYKIKDTQPFQVLMRQFSTGDGT